MIASRAVRHAHELGAQRCAYVGGATVLGIAAIVTDHPALYFAAAAVSLPFGLGALVVLYVTYGLTVTALTSVGAKAPSSLVRAIDAPIVVLAYGTAAVIAATTFRRQRAPGAPPT